MEFTEIDVEIYKNRNNGLIFAIFTHIPTGLYVHGKHPDIDALRVALLAELKEKVRKRKVEKIESQVIKKSSRF